MTYDPSALNIFATASRQAWRDYLMANYQTLNEVWFVFPTLEANEESLSYNDAVEEALCFGWIDSTNRRLDDTHCIRRFSPRKKGSPYSQPNIERLIWLNERDLLLPEVRESVLPIIETPFQFPKDIIRALKKDPEVYENYLKFSDSYKRIRIAYIDAARNRPEEFKKRLDAFIKKTKAGKMIMGYGGIEKYYR